MPAEITPGGAGPRAEVIEALRKIWLAVPSARAVLEDVEARRTMTDLMLTLVKPEHTVVDCQAKLTGYGYKVLSPGEVEPATVTVTAAAPKRTRPPRTAPTPSIAVPTSSKTQSGKLLVAYDLAGVRGLNYDEAKVSVGISDAEGAWKRVSELRAAALIEFMVDEHGEVEHRVGEAGVLQQVCVITDYGKAVVATMEDE